MPNSTLASSTCNDNNGVAVNEVITESVDNAIPGFMSYRTVEETFSDLEQLAADNSNIATWLDISDSYDKITPSITVINENAWKLDIISITALQA